MTDEFLKSFAEINKKDGYMVARYEWHKKMFNFMKWVHDQAVANEDNIDAYLAYERCFNKLDEILDGDYK